MRRLYKLKTVQAQEGSFKRLEHMNYMWEARAQLSGLHEVLSLFPSQHAPKQNETYAGDLVQLVNACLAC